MIRTTLRFVLVASRAFALLPACGDHSTGWPDDADARLEDGRDGDRGDGEVDEDAEEGEGGDFEEADGDIVGDGDCEAGLHWCGTACVDFSTDPDNCGDCNIPCGDAHVCNGGHCELDCSPAPGVRACGEECVDLFSDPDHCGTCDTVCDDPLFCAGGLCEATCPPAEHPDWTQCDRSCVDLQTSLAHCGHCDNPCANTQWCIFGECKDSPCATGDLYCSEYCTPQDRDNCGACDHACDSLTSCCDTLFVAGMACVNTNTDRLYCGSCTHICDDGQECADGACVTPHP